jgi:hypothetical protein
MVKGEMQALNGQQSGPISHAKIAKGAKTSTELTFPD